jgi:hypothetical protein
MAPVVHGLEAEWSGEIRFTYLDIDDDKNSAILRLLGFRYQPHFFLLDAEGEILKHWIGSVEVQEFERAFIAALEG